MGVSSARNMAIIKSKGELISFLDSDDLWHPNKLAIQIEYLKNNPNVHLVYSDYIIKSEIVGSHKNSSEFTPKHFRKCNIHDLFFQNHIGILTVLLKKKCLSNNDVFDTSLKGAEDYELWLRLALDYNLHYIPQSLATYCWHGENTSNDKFMMAKQEAKAICLFIDKSPDVYKILGKNAITTRLFNLYNEIGDFNIWPTRNAMEAQYFYFLAFKQRPLDMNIRIKLFKAFIPSHIFNYIAWRWKKLVDVFE